MKNILFALALMLSGSLSAEDGYRLWLRYDKVSDGNLLHQYQSYTRYIQMPVPSPSLVAAREELLRGLRGLTAATPANTHRLTAGSLLVGTPVSLPVIRTLHLESQLLQAGDQGFLIVRVAKEGRSVIIIAANTDLGVLYGVFHFLRLLQSQQRIDTLSIVSAPAFRIRMLDHWDNLNRTIERGYAGFSLWDWHTLPDYIDQRYKDYARANASVGINGTVLNNVNANPLILTPAWLEKTAALADVFRPYGIRVYLSAKFSAPIEIGGLPTADPMDDRVRQWWKEKVNEIYRMIPDFGGFLIKANSEGQPGPQNYGRTHADGANMLADALSPHGGTLIWRAFVYSNETPDDRAKQAYNEFTPLDGKFRENVWIQVKNGPIDFQPREPFHPLFGAMPRTRLIPEFQLTQEYLGFATHLVFLAPLIKETLNADTYAKGKGSTVASLVAPGIAAVANTGNDINWCGHPFAQANWYAFGRLAWDPGLSSAAIAGEWIRTTFTNDPVFISAVASMMLASREIAVSYMTPLGLHHIMGYNHHYGPAPWYDSASRKDWNPVYYHKADKTGLGFDRTATGSNALAQYSPQARQQWENPDTCPDQWLLWFHHVPWDHHLSTGRDLWEELCHKYYAGADSARWMLQTWEDMKGRTDPERFDQVRMLLGIQAREAVWWRDACLLYFQTFSGRPLPAGYPPPAHDLRWYKALSFPYAPGIQTK